ncbi:glycosyltransferase [Cytophagaceae bacterium ABcell3]|nr:glycosyltransferase [Cytophagaceae bacterium ABcell3]
MKSERPLFSVIIPTYNRAGHLAAALRSVIQQSFHEFEVIVVDDGSTDGTEEVVRSFEDVRIRYFRKANEERSIARNFGIDKSLGAYVTFLDSDDFLYEDHLAVALQMAKDKSNPEVFHLSYEIKSLDGVLRMQMQSKGDINKRLIYGNFLSCIGVFVRGDIIKKHRFNTDLDIIGSEDYELWMRLAARYKIHASSHITACLTEHVARSVNAIEKNTVVLRIEKLYQYLLEDDAVRKYYDRYMHVIKSQLYLYCALHLLEAKFFPEGRSYFFKAFKAYPTCVFSKKGLVLMKKLIFKA